MQLYNSILAILKTLIHLPRLSTLGFPLRSACKTSGFSDLISFLQTFNINTISIKVHHFTDASINNLTLYLATGRLSLYSFMLANARGFYSEQRETRLKLKLTFNCWRYCTALNFSSLLHVLPFHYPKK